MPTGDAYLRPRALVRKLELKPGQRIGDFGVGGAAAWALPLAKTVAPEGEVYLFDILKTALSAALTALKVNQVTNCKAVWANLEQYEGARGVRQDSLDAGVLVNVLHQTSKPKDVLAEVHRMLKPGAKLMIVDWHPDAKVNFAPDERARMPAEHIEELARSLGFAPLEAFSAGPYHWGLLLAKT